MEAKEGVAQTIYRADDVARYIIHLASQEIIGADEQGRPRYEGITNLKLQKILYFAQAYYLAVLRKPLFSDEIEAWQYGPVVREVYDAYKPKKDQAIFSQSDESSLAPEDKEILREVVWEDFGRYSTSHLVTISHAKPWESAISKGQGKQIISQKSIQKYYEGALR